MPRRRKHRKHGKHKHRKQQGTSEEQYTAISSDRTEKKVHKIEESLHHNNSETLVSSSNDYSTPLRAQTPRRRLGNKKDSFELETPVKTNHWKNKPTSPGKSEPETEFFNDCTPLETPVKKRRSLNRQNEERPSGKWNVTNLNMLFDSNVMTESSEICLRLNSEGDRRRSSSSIPKLHSPGKEKPLSFHKSTQTMDEAELEKANQDLLTETPRINPKLTGIHTDIEIDKLVTKLNNQKTSNQLAKLASEVEFNINPYFKDKELISIDLNTQKTRYQKEGSVEELSFFSPQLFEMKSSSTPIDRMHKGQKLLSYLKESVVRENLEGCVGAEGKWGYIGNKIDGTPLREVIHRTPRSEKIKDGVLNNSFDLTLLDSAHKISNVNLNTPPLTEKVINKDKSNSIKLLGTNKRNLGASASRIHNRTSPKISRLVNHSRLLNKNLYSKINVSRRSSIENPYELAGPPGLRVGMYDRLINKIKRYSKASAKWSLKMMEACAQLGIQIKNSLASLCTAYNENSILECSKMSCKCEDYKNEIASLNVKIETLNEEVINVRKQIEEYHKSEKCREGSVEKLHEELIKVKQELSTFTDLHSELTSLKEQFKCFKEAPPASIMTTAPAPFSCVPPPPAPPPPPPPPPMPLLSTQKAPPKLGLGKKAKSSLGLGMAADRGDSRPVISLDEILKVKLKKASERPTTTPNPRIRNNSNPVVSRDLLRQVKLRPRSTLLKATTTPGINNVCTLGGGSSASSEASTSPHSSLCRILSGDPEVVAVGSGKNQGQNW